MEKDQKRQQLQPHLFLLAWDKLHQVQENIYTHFLRSMEENVEIVTVKITLVNLVLWYLGCFNSTLILYSRATR